MKKLLLALICVALPCSAADFPTKTVRIVVGFPAGGPSDVPARLIAEKLRVSLGQPVIVENKPGAAGMIAANDVFSQPADGHTLLLCSYIDPINTLLFKKVAYRVEDLEPVSLVQKAYYAFAVPEALPVNSLADFVRYAKARPGELNYGRVGAGSVTEVLARQFERLAGVTMTGVTFKGTGPAMQEVVAGRIQFMVSPIAVAMPLYQGKRVKLLGTTSPERLPVAPEVPTLAEQGVKIVNYGWWGVCGRGGTPKPVVELLNKHVVAAVESPEYRSVIEKAGAIPASSTIAEFSRVMADTVKEAAEQFRTLRIEQID